MTGNRRVGHPAPVTINLSRLASEAAPFAGPLTAVVMALVGTLLARGHARWTPVVAPAAALAGWATAAGMTWRTVASPHAVAESLVGSAALLLAGSLVAVRWRSRWVGVVAVLLACWWLSGTPAARPEYWRVLFGAVAGTVILGRTRGSEPRRVFAVAATLWGAAMLAGTPAGAGLALVLAAVAAVLWAARDGASIPPGLPMVALVAVMLGSGRVTHGGVGLVDLACLGALATPALVPVVERTLRGWTRRAAPMVAPLLVAVLVVGAAWVTAKLWRGHAL